MRKQLEALNGYLISAGNGGFVEQEFSYRIIQAKSMTNVMAGGIAIDFVEVKQSIYTSELGLSFAKGKPIRLADGKVMTIEAVQEDIDEKVATFDGVGLVGYYITLNGGK